MSALLEFCNVSFSWKQHDVLRDASFSMEHGEAVALLGPNGAGKTTLLRLAAGLLQPGAGQVLFHQKPISELHQRQRARSIALVPQRLHVPFAFTVQQIVEQARTPHVGLLGKLAPADHEAVERALELTFTAQFRHRPMQELSGGEQQRVKIALGLAQGSEILLLDEPAQSLDAGWQRNLLATISNLRQERITILAAVHELHLVAEFFPRSLLLDREQPLQDGPTGAILSSDALQRAFYGPSQQYTASQSSGGGV
jgi:iron complex transport system ATP-binding protein